MQRQQSWNLVVRHLTEHESMSQTERDWRGYLITFAMTVPGSAALIVLIQWKVLNRFTEPWQTIAMAALWIGLLTQTLISMAPPNLLGEVPRSDPSSPREEWPWWFWPILPLWAIGGFLFVAQLVPLAFLSIPYFIIYPDRHAHVYDGGTASQRERLAKWRAHYARLSFRQRVARAVKIRWRRGLMKTLLSCVGWQSRNERSRQTSVCRRSLATTHGVCCYFAKLLRPMRRTLEERNLPRQRQLARMHLAQLLANFRAFEHEP